MARQIAAEGVRTRKGNAIESFSVPGGTIYKLLANRVYLGDAVHKGVAYPGEHQPIIGRELWARVHDILRTRPATRAANARARAPALLKGMLFGPQGEAMTPTHTRSGGRLYRYYISHRILKAGATGAPISRVPAGEIETVVVVEFVQLLHRHVFVRARH